ncbi:MAG: ATP synthase F1 subunit epsilon [Aggregatilineales bacterium]
MPIHIEVVSQERLVFEDTNVDMVVVPATEGIMGVLPRHAPILTTLGFGELIVRKGNAEERFAIYGGVVDVRPGKVVVLADLAASSFDIDAAAAQEARDRAEKLIAEGVPEEENRQATLALRQANLELKISRNMSQRAPVLRILEDDE